MKKIDNLFLSLARDILNENVTDYPRKELAKDVWEKNGKIKPAIKKEILARFTKWQEKMFPGIRIKNIYVLGSITTFQYNDTSDIDINIITSNTKEEINNLWKTLPNGNTINDHPVNYYLSIDTKDVDRSKTLYDLENDTWVKEPSEKQNKMPNKYTIEIAKFFMDGIDLRLSEYERDKKELKRLEMLKKDKNSYFEEDEIAEEIAKIEQEIMADKEAIRLAEYILKSFRNEGFKDEGNKFSFKIKIDTVDEEDPNTSLNNIIYKEIERFGYFEKIHEVLA